MNFHRFDAYVDAHIPHVLDQLTNLCRIPSISAENGPAIREAAALVEELCQEAGVDVQTIHHDTSPPVLVGRAGSGPGCLMIYNHYDVQPPDPLEEWSSPPFEPQMRDGILYARGAADNKGDLLARLTAIRAYQETLGPLPLRVLTIFEGEEEMGSPHLFEFARSHADILRAADGCLWEFGYKNTDNRPVINLGVKGILAVELHVLTAQSDAHSANGGLFPNAAWRLVQALNTLRAPDGQVLIDGLLDHVRAPQPQEEALLAQIPCDAAAIRRAAGLYGGLLGNLEGQSALRRLLLEPTCTINGIIGGYTGRGSKTVIPRQAMAKLDLRLVPDLTPAIVVRLLREHLARRGFDDVEVVDLKDGLQPMRTDPNAEIVRAVVDAIADVSAQPPLLYPCSAGSGPMYELCGIHGVPVASSGVAWYGSRAHAPNESIRIADFVEGIKVVGRLIHRFARAIPQPISSLPRVDTAP